VEVEGLGDLVEGGEGPGAVSEEGGTKYFSESFDPESLPAALREPYQAMRNQFDELSKNVPGADTLEALRVKAQGFDRIAQSEPFLRYLEREESEGGHTPNVEEAIPELAELDEDTRKALQTIVDRSVETRVKPIEEAHFAEKARVELEACERDYGKDWKDKQEAIFHVMKRDGLPARKAYLQLKGEESLAFQKQQTVQTTGEKLAARTHVGDGSSVSTPPPAPKRFKTMREAMLAAEEQYIAGDAWDPSTYALQAGHI
jgi:predicted DNA binding CopG/RHH family protein